VTGLLVERGDVPGLTQALHQLATDGATRERMGREARHRAEKYFDWSVAAGRLESLYRQQLQSPLARGGKACWHADSGGGA